MSFVLVRSKEEVCRERASVAANLKYDPIIKKKREEYSRTRNVKIMQEIIKLSREKSKFYEKAYLHHFENYVPAADRVSDKTPKRVSKRLGFKDFTDYLTDALKDI